MGTPPMRRLGTLLVDAKVLSEQALDAALERQRETGKRLGAVLVDMGLLDEQAIVAALGIQFGMPVADCHQRPELDAVARLPEPIARTVEAAPLRQTPLGLEVAVAGPLDRSEIELLEQAVGGHVVARLARDEDVRSMMDLAYAEAAGGAPFEDSPDILHTVVAGAVRAGASDVHIVPDVTGARVLYRVDGVLRDAGPLAPSARAALAREAREARRGGAGAAGLSRRARPASTAWFPVVVEGRSFRVAPSSCATAQGERLRLRVAGPDSGAVRRLDELGMPDDVAGPLAALLARTSGLIVIAGARRSGRTTTAYAIAADRSAAGRAVVVVERTAARLLGNVGQIEVGAEPLGRASLHAAEDQDADVTVVDDLEGPAVARAALRLAQRGMLVVMTVTAVDAADTLAPFLDAGVPLTLVEAGLLGVLRQRLDGGRVAVFELSAGGR